jgi:hypothetical protein
MPDLVQVKADIHIHFRQVLPVLAVLPLIPLFIPQAKGARFPEPLIASLLSD